MHKNKQENQHLKLLEEHSKLSTHYLTGHDLEWYFRIIGKPILYLTTLNIAFYLISGLPNLNEAYEAVFIPIIFITELITYGWLGWKVAYKASWKTILTSMKIASAGLAGGLTAVFLGVAMSLFKLFWFRDTWTFFNIITEPTIRLLEGIVVAGLAGLITIVIIKYKKHRDYS